MNFYTIIPINEPASFIKDPGMIPYNMAMLGFTSHFVSYTPKDTCFASLINKHVEIDTLFDDRKGKPLTLCSFSILKYILRNSRKIDVLHLFYIKHSIFYALTYKILHKRGILYVKLDLNIDSVQAEMTQFIAPFRRLIFGLYLRFVPDLISVEHTRGYEFMRTYYRIPQSRLLLVPNGVDVSILKNPLGPLPYDKRQNVIITVGRIGSPEKRHDMLLDAIGKVRDMKDWMCLFVGPIDSSFRSQIELFYETNRDKRDAVKFVGPMYDRDKLFSLINSSKIFCLTSQHEGFCLALCEAQYFGNYIFATNVSGVDDIIKNDVRLGKYISSSDDLSKEIELAISTEYFQNSFEFRIKCGTQYSWPNICGALAQFLRGI